MKLLIEWLRKEYKAATSILIKEINTRIDINCIDKVTDQLLVRVAQMRKFNLIVYSDNRETNVYAVRDLISKQFFSVDTNVSPIYNSDWEVPSTYYYDKDNLTLHLPFSFGYHSVDTFINNNVALCFLSSSQGVEFE
jgi:hypothetical protein